MSVTLLAIVAALLVGAGDPARTHDVTIDDYFTIAHVESPVVAPDGSAIAYVELRWEPEQDRRNSDVWVVDAASGRRTRLTFDPASDESPAWSPDGAWVYFTSARTRGEDAGEPPWNDRTQVWRVPRAGGEADSVTREAEGVGTYRLAADGGGVYYTVSAEKPRPDEWAALRAAFEDLEYGDGAYTPGAVRRLDLESWRVETLVDVGRVIRDFAVSRDGGRIAMITTPDDTLFTFEGWSRVDVWEAATGSVRAVPDRLFRAEAPSPFGWIIEPSFADDGGALAFRVDFDGYPGEIHVATFDMMGSIDVRRVTRPGEVTCDGPMRWIPGTRDLAFLAQDRARARVYRVRDAHLGGERPSEVLTPGDVAVSGFSLTADGATLAFARPGLEHPIDLFLGDVDEPGAGQRVTRLNPQVDAWKVPVIRIVSWTAPDGTTVEGILELPPGWSDGDPPIPMVVSIHGGPTAASLYQFRYWMYGHTIMPSRGWALFSPNYRGSTGYGDRFITDLIGRENDVEVADILAGVDALCERGIADPDRLAVMGWSNGGYLTNCLITTTDRFKAASSGAGVFDQVMQWALEDTPGHVVNYMTGLPWSVAEEMRRASPLHSADRISTPTLVHAGADDERVPAAHGRALYRALHRYLGVPCELVVYPGAGHALTTYTHRKAKLTWDLAWFARWLEPGSAGGAAGPEGASSSRSRRGVTGFARHDAAAEGHDANVCPACAFKPVDW